MTNQFGFHSTSGAPASASPKKTSASLFWIGVVVALVIGVLNLVFDGNLAATIGLIFVTLLVGFSVFRPSISLYALVFCSLAIEQLNADYSWTKPLPYYVNLSNIIALLKGMAITPMEMHLLCIVAGLLLRFALLREKAMPVLAWRGMIVYAVGIVFFIVYGVIRGGTLLTAVWEIRGIIYLFLLMLIVPQIIRTEKQVNYVVRSIIAGLVFRAVEVTTHYVGANFSVGAHEGWGSHEDAGMIVTLLVFTVALYTLKVPKKRMKILLTLLSIPFVLAVIGSDRRTAYPVLAASLTLLAVMMPREIQRRVLNVSWKFAVLFIIYLAVFWESKSENALLMPVRNIRMGFAGDDEQAAGDAYTSNLYRKAENYDLFRMITDRPLLGTGYGIPIDYSLPVPIMWDLGFYIPHNQIFGVIAKTGVLGFIIFMMFYLSVLSEIADGFAKHVDNKYLRAVLVLAGAAVVNHLVFSFFDIMLTYYKNNIYLGVLLGIAATIITIEQQRPKEPLQEKKPEPKRYNTPARWLLMEPAERVSDPAA